MSDIKKLLLRLPVSTYEKIEMQAVQLNVSINHLICLKLANEDEKLPPSLKVLEGVREVAHKAPGVYAGVDHPEMSARAEKKRAAAERLADCPRCGSPTIPWGVGRRCEKCGRNW